VLKVLVAIQTDNKLKTYLENKDAKRDELLTSGSIKYNFPTVTQNDDKNKTIAKTIAGNAGTMQWYNEHGVAQERETLNPDNIEPVSKGYSMLKLSGSDSKQPVLTFKYKTGEGSDKFEIRKVPLTPTQAQALGFGTEVKDLSGYDFGLHLNGKVEGVKTVSGKDYDLQYDIVRANPRNQNDQRVFVRVIKDGSPIILFSDNPLGSYQQAIQFMEGATKMPTIKDAFYMLDQLSQGNTTLPKQK
jgi:hypothetical protein